MPGLATSATLAPQLGQKIGVCFSFEVSFNRDEA